MKVGNATITNPSSMDMDSVIGELIKKHSISSDSGVGESKFGDLYEWMFKKKTSDMYEEQVKLHSNER